MTDITYTQQQADIILDPDLAKDSLIVAGAGSGKTFTMTRRIVQLIKQGVSAGSILGLTFSRKAAAELDARVGQAVDEEARQAGSGQVFLHPEISTYDAFFQQIVRQYGLLIGISQGMVPLSDAGCYEVAASVVTESAAEIFAAFVGDQRPGTDQRSDTADQAVPDAADSVGGDSAGRFDALVADVIRLSNECLSFMIDEDCRSVSAAVARANAWNEAFLGRLNVLLQEEERKDPGFYAETEAMKRIGDIGVKEYQPDEKDSERATRQYNSHKQALFRVMELRASAKRRQVLLGLVLKYDQRKRERGFAEYADFTVYAFNLLTRFPSIGEQYRRRFSHVFLDEYQDTSTTQAKLIALLFHSEQKPSAVTAVGDPFQAIYGFRGASPGAFALFCRDFEVETSAVRSLTRTMRNRPLVLEVANTLTRSLRQPEYLWRSTGRPTTAVEEVAVQPLQTLDGSDHRGEGSAGGQPGDGAGTSALAAEVGTETGADATFAALGYSSSIRQIEAVARFARYECQKNADAPKPAVAVLFRGMHRTRQTIEDYRKVMESQGLRVQTIGTSVLMSQPEVRDLFTLLQTVSDHSNSAALLRLLASPRFGLSARALERLAGRADNLNSDRQYAALVAAGLAQGDESLARQRELVHQHRDDLPVLASLVDLLEEDRSLLLGQGVFSPAQERAVTRLSTALLHVEAARAAALPDIVTAAIRALDLDIDTRLAQDISQAGASSSQANLDEFLALTVAYAQELPPGLSASLSGFINWIEAAQKPFEATEVTLDAAADVVLMTVHQSKGLEWPAVAVVNMETGSFPSNKSVKLEEDPSAPLTLDGSAYSMASTSPWLKSATSVPVPVRSDADALPAFPWALAGQPGRRLSGEERTRRAIEALDSLTTVDALDEQVYKPNPGLVENRLAPPTLSLEEEYGSRNHADERRLAYVAITRSRGSDVLEPGDVFRSGDVLVTFSAHRKDSDKAVKDGTALKTDVNPQGAGVFWQDIAQSLQSRPETIRVCPPGGLADETTGTPSAAAAVASATAPDQGAATAAGTAAAVAFETSGGVVSWPAAVARQMTGLVCGPDVANFLDVLCAQNQVVGEDELKLDVSTQTTKEPTWPLTLGSELTALLADSADQVRQVKSGLVRTAASEERSTLSDGSLLATAQALLEVDQSLDDWEKLRARAAAILADSSLGVTVIQSLASQREREGQLAQLQGIARPIPRPPSRAADLGNRFHEWAQAYLSEGDIDLVADVESADLTSAQSLADDERQMQAWQDRLRESDWAGRSVFGLERPYVIAVAGQARTAKIDAIFYGGLDGQLTDSAGRPRFTIVDWKTGRRPVEDQAIKDKLIQLDLYRLALARNEEIDIGNIDACLYYVDVAEPAQRQLVADSSRGEQRIVTDLQAALSWLLDPPADD